MFKHDQRWWDGEVPGFVEGDWKKGIKSMIDYGVRRVKAGEYDALHFNVYNKEEVDLVNELMKEHQIPYQTTRVV